MSDEADFLARFQQFKAGGAVADPDEADFLARFNAAKGQAATPGIAAELGGSLARGTMNLGAVPYDAAAGILALADRAITPPAAPTPFEQFAMPGATPGQLAQARLANQSADLRGQLGNITQQRQPLSMNELVGRLQRGEVTGQQFQEMMGAIQSPAALDAQRAGVMQRMGGVNAQLAAAQTLTPLQAGALGALQTGSGVRTAASEAFPVSPAAEGRSWHNPMTIANATLENAPQIAAQLAVAFATGGAGTAGQIAGFVGSGTAMELADATRSQVEGFRRQGMSELDALRAGAPAAAVTAAVNGALERLSAAGVLPAGDVARKALEGRLRAAATQALKGAAAESVTEMGQEGVSAAGEAISGADPTALDPARLVPRVGTAGLSSFFLGGGAGAVAGATQPTARPLPQQPQADVNQTQNEQQGVQGAERVSLPDDGNTDAPAVAPVVAGDVLPPADAAGAVDPVGAVPGVGERAAGQVDGSPATGADAVDAPKQPWQMTRKEFARNEKAPMVDAIKAHLAAGGRVVQTTQYRATPLNNPNQVRLASDGTVQMAEGRGRWVTLLDDQVRSLFQQAGGKPVPFEQRVYHRAEVADALAAGRPVPAEVLAEYPDLVNGESDGTTEDTATGDASPVELAGTDGGRAGNGAGSVSAGRVPGDGADLPNLRETGAGPVAGDAGQGGTAAGPGVKPKTDRYKGVIGVPDAKKPPRKRGYEFSRNELANEIVDAFRGSGVDTQYFYDENDGRFFSDDASGVFTFRDKLPTEVVEFLKGEPGLRSLFQVAESGRTRGLETMYDMGDKYWDFARESRKTNALPLALKYARNSQDPALQFKANLLEHIDAIKRNGERVAPSKITDPKTLPVGTTFTVQGERFVVEEVEMMGDKVRVMRDGDTFGTTPIDFLEAIPVDRKSINAVPAPAEPKAKAPESVAPPRSLPTINVAAGTEPGDQGSFFGQADVRSSKPATQRFMFDLRRSMGSELDAQVKAEADAKPDGSNTATMFEDDGSGDEPAPFSGNVRESRGTPNPSAPAAPKWAYAPGNARIPPAPITPPKGAEPIKLRDLFDQLGTTLKRVRAGNPGRGAAGVYKPGSTDTIIRYTGDIDTAIHEVGHFLNDRYALTGDYNGRQVGKNGQPTNRYVIAPFDRELIPHFSQYGSSAKSGPRSKLPYVRREGVAEWFRAYVVNPDAAKAAAPVWFAHAKTKLPAEVWTNLDAFSTKVRQLAGSGGSAMTLANVDTDMRPITSATRLQKSLKESGFGSGWIDKLEAAFIDDLAPVFKGFEAAMVTRGADLEMLAKMPSQDLRVTARLYRGIEGKVASILDKGMIDGQGQPISGRGGLDWLLEPFKGQTKGQVIADMEAAISLGISERTLEKAAQLGRDRVSGTGAGLMSDVDVANQTIRELSADPQRMARLKEGLTRYRQWSNSLLDYAQAKGRMSAEQVQKIKDSNQAYIAMNRLADEAEEAIAFKPKSDGTQKLGSARENVKRFTGSTKTIRNPYESLIRQTAAIVREADRNATLRQLADALTITRGMEQGEVKNLAEIGVKAASTDDNTIKVFRDGKAEHWKFAPSIYRALKGMDDPGQVEGFLRVLTAAASFTRRAITASPAFQIRNKIRDALAAGVNSRAGRTPFDEAALLTKAGRESFRTAADEMQRAGGANFADPLRSTNDYKQRLSAAVQEVSKDRRTVLATVKSLAGGYDHFTQKMENTGRAAEYRRAFAKGIREGMTREDAQLYAALQARDVLDFSRGGYIAKSMNRFVPFTNAAIQGMNRTVRAVRENPKGTAIRFTATMVLPSLLVYAWNAATGGEDELRQMPAWRRDFFWNLKMGPDMWLSIPKPIDMGFVDSLIWRGIDAARGKPNAMEGAMSSAARALLPVDDTAFVGGLKPFVELKTNRDLFTDRAIVPSWEENLPVADRKGTATASRIGKLVQEAVGADARTVDQFIRSSLGGTGSLLLTASNVGRDDKPESGEALAGALTGVLANSPASSSSDYLAVMRIARAYPSIGRADGIESLRAIAKAYVAERDPAKRDTLAKRLRDEAAKLRPAVEAEQRRIEAARK